MSSPSQGGGTVRAGYLFTDESGNLAVNRETFNIYDGPTISLSDFRYLTGTGINITADLQQISLDNRNLRGSISVPGHIGLSLYQSNYRRIYSYNGEQATTRKMTGIKFHLTPMKFLRFHYGYRLTDRAGATSNISSPLDNIEVNSVDYKISEYNIGLRAYGSYGKLSAEVRKFKNDVKSSPGQDRQAESFNLNGSTQIPYYDWLTVSGGFYHRVDELNILKPTIITDQGWGGLRGFLPRGYNAEYRFLFARTDNGVTQVETDNVINTISVGRDWSRKGSIRIGYENRISDDLVDRAEAHLILFSGWWQATEKINIRSRVSSRFKKIKTGATLLGDEDYTHHRVTINYQYPDWIGEGKLSLRWEGRVRTNDDIETEIDYNSLAVRLSIKRAKLGQLRLSYALNRGEYDNRSLGAINQFRFSDHVINGSLMLPPMRNLQATIRGGYYRSQRDRDLEKSNIGLNFYYSLPRAYAIEFDYQVFNFDDYLRANNFYTGNIVHINFAKNFSFF